MLRDGIARYRDHEGKNGRPLAWKIVIEEIVMCDNTAHGYGKDGQFPEFKEEALRRFAQNVSLLTEDKLADIEIFLKEKGYLSDAQMDDCSWSLPAALALSSVFSQHDLPKKHLDGLGGAYEAVFQAESGPDWARGHHDIEIEPIDGKPVARVKRDAVIFPFEVSDIKAEKRRMAHKSHRTFGYCVGDPISGIMVFLRDEVTRKVDIMNITRAAFPSRVSGAATAFEASTVQPVKLEELKRLPEEMRTLRPKSLTFRRISNGHED